MEKIVFISHSSANKEIAEIVVNFLNSIGILKSNIFCSSLPDTGIDEKINKEIKENLDKSCLNIVILSKEYYESVYCLQESGIIWHSMDIPCYILGLPEINHNNMQGFINGDYIIRRLDVKNDLMILYDKTNDIFGNRDIKATSLNIAADNAIKEYEAIISERKVNIIGNKKQINKNDFELINNLCSDDSKIVLYFIIKSGMKKFNYIDIYHLLNQEKIIKYDLESGINTLKNFFEISGTKNEFEIKEEIYVYLLKNSYYILDSIKSCIERHVNNPLERFIKKIDNKEFSDQALLFIKYVRDTDDCELGCKYIEQVTVKRIKKWERKNNITNIVSGNYERIIKKMFDFRFIYKKGWNVRYELLKYSFYSEIMDYIIGKKNDLLENQINDAICRNKKHVFWNLIK